MLSRMNPVRLSERWHQKRQFNHVRRTSCFAHIYPMNSYFSVRCVSEEITLFVFWAYPLMLLISTDNKHQMLTHSHNTTTNMNWTAQTGRPTWIWWEGAKKNTESFDAQIRKKSHTRLFSDPEGRSQKATLVVVVVISSLRVKKSLRLS